MEDQKGGKAAKVYCEKCNEVFDSRERFERHMERHTEGHSGFSMDACPLDSAISRVVKFFKGK